MIAHRHLVQEGLAKPRPREEAGLVVLRTDEDPVLQGAKSCFLYENERKRCQNVD